VSAQRFNDEPRVLCVGFIVLSGGASGTDSSCFDHLPAFCSFAQSSFMDWPIMQSRWIKVCAIWPHQSMHFSIEGNSIEETNVIQRRVQFACQDRLEVDGLNTAVVESYSKDVSSNDFELAYFVNRMPHIPILEDQWAGVFFPPAMSSNQPSIPADAVQPTLPRSTVEFVTLQDFPVEKQQGA
jgi:hypothetical protein